MAVANSIATIAVFTFNSPFSILPFSRRSPPLGLVALRQIFDLTGHGTLFLFAGSSDAGEK
jgi:hypothetical protein